MRWGGAREDHRPAGQWVCIVYVCVCVHVRAQVCLCMCVYVCVCVVVLLLNTPKREPRQSRLGGARAQACLGTSHVQQLSCHLL